MHDLHDLPRRPDRRRAGGRRASGLNGEPRDQVLSLRHGKTEGELIEAMLRRRGLPADADGVRTLLLRLAQEDAPDAAAA